MNIVTKFQVSIFKNDEVRVKMNWVLISSGNQYLAYHSVNIKEVTKERALAP